MGGKLWFHCWIHRNMEEATVFYISCLSAFFFLGFPEKRPSPRHLLPPLALPRPPISPRAEAGGTLRIRLPPQKGRSLCQPLSLYQSWPTSASRCSCTHYQSQKQWCEYLWRKAEAGGAGSHANFRLLFFSFSSFLRSRPLSCLASMSLPTLSLTMPRFQGRLVHRTHLLLGKENPES